MHACDRVGNRSHLAQWVGVDGTGDVTKNDNIRSFARVVDKGTKGKGVALFMAGVCLPRVISRVAHACRVMCPGAHRPRCHDNYAPCADGGFSVEGEENYQEERLKQLVLCQFTTALACVKQGGAFVCKVFDTFTPFVVGLVFILYRHFEVHGSPPRPPPPPPPHPSAQTSVTALSCSVLSSCASTPFLRTRR